MRLRIWTVLLCLLMLPVLIYAQNTVTISGGVLDEAGVPLASANILVKGTSIGAASNLTGNFSFKFQATGSFTIQVRYIGYKTYEQTFRSSDKTTDLEIVLKNDVFMGEAVVVTGIATKRSKSVAEVAVARIDAAELTKTQSFQDISQLVAGKIAGVNVQNVSGNVGSGVRFNVRSGGGLNGNEQPLIIIDGIRMDNSTVGTGVGGQQFGTLSDLDPEDIADIDFLKGPAGAASYGTNGSNGVVIITTKRGRIAQGQGKNMNIQYKLVTGMNQQAKEYTEDMILTYKDANANFVEGLIQQHVLNISGGSEMVKYFVGLNKRREDGIMRGNMMDRTTFRANIDIIPNDKLMISVNSSFGFNENKRPLNDDNIGGYLGNTVLGSKSYLFLKRDAIKAFDDKINSNRFLGGFKAQYRPFDKFEASFSVGVDHGNIREDRLFPKAHIYPFGFPEGRKWISERRNTQFTYDFNTSYSYAPFDGLSIVSNVGAQIFDRKLHSVFIEKYGFATGLITNIGAGEELSSGDEGHVHTRDVGLFTSHSLNYFDKYFMTLMVRKEFASSIGADAPSIIYPSFQFATRLDRLGLAPSFFNMLKIRAAYGESGRLPGRLAGIPVLWYAQQSGYGSAAWLSNIGNTSIKPERIKEFEIGFDAELFTYYSAEITYYKQYAEDSIIDFLNSPSTGLTASAIPYNVGGVDGWGIESMLQGKPIRARNFEMDFSLINNIQKNEVTDLGGAQPIYDGSWNYCVINEGMPKHSFFMPKVAGADFNEDGSYKGVRLENDGKNVFIGNPVPEYTGSFSLSFRIFKKFRINALAEWARGHQILNLTRLWSINFTGRSPLGANVKEYLELQDQLGLVDWYDDKAAYDIGSAEYNEAAEDFARMDPRYASNFVEDADFLKLREVSVSYDFTELADRFLDKPLFSNLVLGVSGRNLFTLTDYIGPDPEISMGGSNDTQVRGYDMLTLQNPKVYTLWLRVGL
ncbi:TonB-dependent receptor [bacterium]|nr:TonB-dependent receptor [bacterium]